MIKKSYITKYFKTIKIQNDINLEEKLSWGFYFSDTKKEHLYNASKHSSLEMYDFIEVKYCDNLYHLQISKNERHTENTLFQRCEELYNFSKSFSIISFDGFDVEEI